MSSSHVDRNLLFGFLALQNNFISHEDLIAAVSVWLTDKTRSLDEILSQRRALQDNERQLLEALVGCHLQKHGNDAEKSLAALSSVGNLRDDLKKLGDADLEASLAHVAQTLPVESPDPDATVSVEHSPVEKIRFRILRPHAAGGLGQVYVARDDELNREVALKEIKFDHANDANSRSRFLLEAEITGGLEHPGIVPVYGLGQYADGRPYYAMRFIRGDSLKEAIARFHTRGVGVPPAQKTSSGPSYDSVEFRQLLGRFIDVCNAIEYAHSRGVLHRDLKPGNIMLGKYGETLVVDWGLAKPQGKTEQHERSDENTLRPRSASGTDATQMGSAIGTPAYMSPEQAAGRLDQLGPASDVYSLGATLYSVLTGQVPFAKSNSADIVRRVQSGEFTPPRQLCPTIPRPLEAICVKAMALRPADRYASPQALADDLERYLADEPILARPESLVTFLRREHRRNPVRSLVWSAGALVAIYFTLLSLYWYIAGLFGVRPLFADDAQFDKGFALVSAWVYHYLLLLTCSVGIAVAIAAASAGISLVAGRAWLRVCKKTSTRDTLIRLSSAMAFTSVVIAALLWICKSWPFNNYALGGSLAEYLTPSHGWYSNLLHVPRTFCAIPAAIAVLFLIGRHTVTNLVGTAILFISVGLITDAPFRLTGFTPNSSSSLQEQPLKPTITISSEDEKLLKLQLDRIQQSARNAGENLRQLVSLFREEGLFWLERGHKNAASRAFSDAQNVAANPLPRRVFLSFDKSFRRSWVFEELRFSALQLQCSQQTEDARLFSLFKQLEGTKPFTKSEVDMLHNDPDFDAFRHKPEFRRIVGIVASKPGAAKKSSHRQTTINGNLESAAQPAAPRHTNGSNATLDEGDLFFVQHGKLKRSQRDGTIHEVNLGENRLDIVSLGLRDSSSELLVLNRTGNDNDIMLLDIQSPLTVRADVIGQIHAPVSDASFNPIDDRVAWCRDVPNSVPDLVISRFNGSEEKLLERGYDPVWTADGKNLLFTCWHQGAWGIGIYDGMEIRRLKVPAHPDVSLRPHPSRDSQLIAFSMQGDDGRMEIGTVSFDGTNIRQVTRKTDNSPRIFWPGPYDELPFGDYNTRPVFSPDGRHIAFLRSNGSLSLNNRKTLVIINVATGREAVLSWSDQVVTPVWRANLQSSARPKE